MKGTLVIGPVSHLTEERDLQLFRLILGNNYYLKFSLQEITCCHHDYLFIFTPVNNYIQEIKRKNSMQFCRENCEETDQQSRRNSIHMATALFLSPCIFSHLREPGFVCRVLQGWVSSFFQVPTQTSAVWGGSCKPPEFLFFCFWNAENSYFYSLFTSPIVSLWARRIRWRFNWLTAQYEQWRRSFPTAQSLQSSSSRGVNPEG